MSTQNKLLAHGARKHVLGFVGSKRRQRTAAQIESELTTMDQHIQSMRTTRAGVACLVLVGFLFAIPAYSQAITTFDAPGAIGTIPVGINPSGAIAGYYADTSGSHGFVRDSGGTITTLDVPGATGTSLSHLAS